MDLWNIFNCTCKIPFLQYTLVTRWHWNAGCDLLKTQRMNNLNWNFTPHQVHIRNFHKHTCTHTRIVSCPDWWTDRWTDVQTDSWTHRWRGRQMKGQTDRQTEDEQRSEQTDKQTETDLRLLARGLRTSTGVPSSSVITMLLVDSARKCLLRRRKSSHVGVVGSYRKVTWYSWSKVGSNTTTMMLKRQSSSVHQTFIMLDNSSVLKATQSYHKTPWHA